MVNYFKICYTAQYPDGKLLNPKQPYIEANIVATTKQEAISNLMMEFPGLKIKVVEEPVKKTTSENIFA